VPEPRPPSLGPLADGAHVIILGGGPAGAACAIRLQRRAAAGARRLRVTIIEGKDFHGQSHYNQCIGVLSPPLPTLLKDDLDIAFPQHLGRGEIREYVLHAGGQQMRLPDEDAPSIALRRVQFDAYMMEQARRCGASIVSARAMDIEFHAQSVLVYTESQPVEGDVVVAAFGLDAGTAGLFTRHTNYRQPQALSSVVTKYDPGPEAVAAFGPRIHAFLPADVHIEFGGITPKGDHLDINIAGRDVDARCMRAFLRLETVRSVLPNPDLADLSDRGDPRLYKGRFPISRAAGYFGDRYVMVGDASGLVRAFKGKGVTSAVQTGIRAADAMFDVGISHQALEAGYHRVNHDILDDLPYGHAMRLAVIAMARTGMMKAVLRAAHEEPRLGRALLGAVDGRMPYREVWKDSLAPRSVAAILRHLFR
jgi:flavin-dependent dehydrogenase